MYWHPTFIQTYTAFLAALAAHLQGSPFAASIIGIEMEFSGIGEAHLDVPAANQKASTWIVPTGVTNGPDWSVAVKAKLSNDCHRRLRVGFPTHPHLRTQRSRYHYPRSPDNRSTRRFHLADYFRQGILWMFHTSSEMEVTVIAVYGPRCE
jgi:hypothetical protein